MNQAPRLRVVSLFEDLPDGDLARVATLCSFRNYERNAQILGEHEQTTDVFFILSGTVRINSYAPTGREIIFNDLAAGAIFGEFSALDRLPRSATAIAIADCLLARMTSANFFEVLRNNSSISIRMLELLVSKIRDMSERVFEVSALSVRERIRRELLRLAAHGTVGQTGIAIRPAPTHYEIASRIGSHREAVTRELNRLEAEKIIAVGRREIRVTNIEQLRSSEES